MVALPSGTSFLFGNQLPPKPILGASYLPAGYACITTPVTTTATRCYYVPFPIYRTSTFRSVITRNSGAGDNGEKYRVMFFKDDAANGGPGTLAKDFGEVTLTGASAYRTLTPGTAWSPTAGMYWGAVWTESASALYAMLPFYSSSDVGFTTGPHMGNMIGDLTASPGSIGVLNVSHCHYVDTAYGAAPATAVAPTATHLGTAAQVFMPAFVLQK